MENNTLSGDGLYSSSSALVGQQHGFNEVGEYRVIICAVDGESLRGRPRVVAVRTGWPEYLPVVIKQNN